MNCSVCNDWDCSKFRGRDELLFIRMSGNAFIAHWRQAERGRTLYYTAVIGNGNMGITDKFPTKDRLIKSYFTRKFRRLSFKISAGFHAQLVILLREYLIKFQSLSVRASNIKVLASIFPKWQEYGSFFQYLVTFRFQGGVGLVNVGDIKGNMVDVSITSTGNGLQF